MVWSIRWGRIRHDKFVSGACRLVRLEHHPPDNMDGNSPIGSDTLCLTRCCIPILVEGNESDPISFLKLPSARASHGRLPVVPSVFMAYERNAVLATDGGGLRGGRLGHDVIFDGLERRAGNRQHIGTHFAICP